MSRVKSITSGDSLVLVDKQGNEQFVSLAYVSAPRVDSQQGGFAGRELLRSLLVGKPVQVRTVYTANERNFVDVRAPVFDSLVEKVLAEGAAKLREDAPVKPGYEAIAASLERAQETARTARAGVWGAGPVRVERECPADLFGSKRQVPAIVEKVLSGDRAILRVLMDPDHHFYGLCLLAGIRAPRSSGPAGAAEPFGDAARDLFSQRLLQRDVRVKVLARGPNELPLVTILHPAGDIARSLVESGLAKFAENHSAQVGSERAIELRKAEQGARAAGYNIWKATADARKARTESSTRAVVEKVLSSDTFVLENDRTVQLSSIVAPRRNSEDHGLWYEPAKEYARALVIGRQVEVLVDGTRTDNDRELVTMALDGKNVAEHIVAAGYAQVRRNQGQSPFIGELGTAEDQAKAKKLGIWGKKPAPSKVVDASESQVRAKAYLSSLERRGRVPGIVEYVAPQSARLRILIPSENCILSAVVAGVKVPRGEEPGAQEVSEYVKKVYTQRDVEVRVLGTDKTGAFTTQTFLPGKKQSLGTYLVTEGLATVFEPAANEYGLRKELDHAQESACDSRKGIWKDYVEPEPAVAAAVATATGALSLSSPSEEVAATSASYRDAIVTNTELNHLSYRLSDKEPTFASLGLELTKFFSAGANSAAHGFARPPRRNDLVVLKQGTSYLRARIIEQNPYRIELLDTGAQREAAVADLRPLPAQFGLSSIPELAITEKLAFIAAPPRDYARYEREYLGEVQGQRVVISSSPQGIFLYTGDSVSAEDSVNNRLIDNGFTYLSKGDGSSTYKRLQELEQACMRDRIGIWEYGDPREDERD